MKVKLIDTSWRKVIQEMKDEEISLMLRLEYIRQEIKRAEKEFPSKGKRVTLKKENN